MFWKDVITNGGEKKWSASARRSEDSTEAVGKFRGLEIHCLCF